MVYWSNRLTEYTTKYKKLSSDLYVYLPLLVEKLNEKLSNLGVSLELSQGDNLCGSYISVIFQNNREPLLFGRDGIYPIVIFQKNSYLFESYSDLTNIIFHCVNKLLEKALECSSGNIRL
jgi:hypothetical protein